MPLFKKSGDKKIETIQKHIEDTKEKLKVVDSVLNRRNAEIEGKAKEYEIMKEAGRELTAVQKVTYMRKLESRDKLQEFREIVLQELDKMLELVVLNEPITKAQEEWLKSLDGTVDELVTWRDNEKMFDETAKRIIDDFDRKFEEKVKTGTDKEKAQTTSKQPVRERT